MRLNARKTLMKALGDASLRDFKTNDEMEQSHALFKLMSKNDGDEDPVRARKAKPVVQYEVKA